MNNDNEDNVIDITNRKELMSRMVEKDAVKFVQIGTSGANHCLTLSKTALIALREGSTFPVELLVGDTKVRFTIMRDTTFRVNLAKFTKINQAAKDNVQAQVDADEEVSKLGKDIGDSPIITE